MRRIYGKIRAALLIGCFYAMVFAGGCSGGEEADQSIISEDVFKLGNQEVQIDLPNNFKCTEQSTDEVVLSGDAGEVSIEYKEEGISSDQFPKSEQECAVLYEDIIGNTSYQIEEFHSYESEGLYYATIRYDFENEIKYLIASGKFGMEYGYQISAVLNTGKRETAEEIQNAVYNVKVFTE